jgi:anaerobic sulfite reductase subunit B
MLTPVTQALLRSGIDAAEIYVAVERYMKCGTGHCGHCYINHRYVCRDGPVFSLAERQALPDAFREGAV